MITSVKKLYEKFYKSHVQNNENLWEVLGEI